MIERNKSHNAYRTGLQTVDVKVTNCYYKYCSMPSNKKPQSPLKTLLSTFLSNTQQTGPLIPEKSLFFPLNIFQTLTLSSAHLRKSFFQTPCRVYLSHQALSNVYLPISGRLAYYYVH